MLVKRRIYLCLCFLTLLLSALTGVLFYRQVVCGKELALLAASQRTMTALPGARGDILDRYGRALTSPEQALAAVIFPTMIPDIQQAKAQLSKILGLEERDLEARLQAKLPFVPDIYLDNRQAAELAILPGVAVVTRTNRYGADAVARHVVGYVNQADTTDSFANLVGRSGLESVFDEVLKTRSWNLAVVADAVGRPIGGIGLRRIDLGKPFYPYDVRTTIDLAIQREVEHVMDRRITRGAVVVMDPESGDILALASRPDYSQNNVAPSLEEDGSPLINRAVRGYVPGSVFKVVVAAAALEEGACQEDDEFYCPGEAIVLGRRVRCSHTRGQHSFLSFKEAVANSCNITFSRIGTYVGMDVLAHYANGFGFGEKTELGLPEEESGLVGGDPVNLSFGQGEVLVTPVQVAGMLATIANDGIRVYPRLLDAVLTRQGLVVEKFPAREGERAISSTTARILKNFLTAVVEEGTSEAAYSEEYSCFGKSGTAESGRPTPQGMAPTDAWFAGCFTGGDKRYVVVVLVENGGWGGKAAAPVFKEIAEKILSIDRDKCTDFR